MRVNRWLDESLPNYRMGHNLSMLRFLLIASALLASLPTFAWNAGGHRLSAAIAWQEMSLPTRAAVSALLARHPAFPEWAAQSNGEDPAYIAFLEASTWPDDIRRDPRFVDNAQATPLVPLNGLTDTTRHRHWHYIDLDARGIASGDGELDRRLAQLIELLSNPRATENDKAYALPWLIHLIGDIHQPLHVGSRHDEGGNRYVINDPFNPRLPESNLHRWWDDRPAPPWLRGKYIERAVARLLARYPEATVQGNVALWKEESWRLAHTRAYPDGPTISAEFRDAADSIAGRRIVEAGRRLGRLLEILFGAVPRETASE